MTRPAVRFQLSATQAAVYRVLMSLPSGGELHNAEIAHRSGLSRGWTSETLRALEMMGLARHRMAQSQSRHWVRFAMWRRV